MADLSRRSLLGLGAAAAVGLLAGCAPPAPTRPTRSSPPARSGPPTRTPSPSPTPSPAAPPDWNTLAGGVSGELYRPGSAGYAQAKLTENPLYDDSTPLAVLSAASVADVVAAVRFASAFDVPLALRSGGHSYPGYSAGGGDSTGMPPSLVIDSRRMAAVTLNGDDSVTVGAGASLAQVYGVLGDAGRALPGGSCATVGITGLTLGGGVGVLARAYGLTCDALTEVRIVTADGVDRRVSATSDEDLFWACRGGGGGHLGVVTSLTFTTVPAPGVTMFFLSWPMANAAAVIAAWQDWAPTADARLWSTVKLLGGTRHPSGPQLTVSGTWIGDGRELAVQLAPLLAPAGAAPSVRQAVTRGYRDAMMRYAGCAGVPVARCTTGPGGVLTRQPSANTSHIANDRLTAAGIADLLARVQAAQSVPGMIEGGISLDALGGTVAAVGPDATAFVHRRALASVQYTSTFAVGAAPGPYYDYVRGFRAAMVPHWGDGAYVNYADASLNHPAQSYFGDNAARLAAVAATYDPAGLFSQPQGY